MALFIEVQVSPELAGDPEQSKRLCEVCPVNIFAQGEDSRLQIVEENLDECTLCELCLHVGPPGSVEVRKLYS